MTHDPSSILVVDDEKEMRQFITRHSRGRAVSGCRGLGWARGAATYGI